MTLWPSGHVDRGKRFANPGLLPLVRSHYDGNMNMRAVGFGCCLAFFLGAGVELRANGGGYVANQGWTGDFMPKGASEVEMLSEDLTIRLGTEAAEVEVVYRLRNAGGRRRVTVGFPCTTLVPPEDVEYTAITPLELEDYAILKNGEPLEFRIEPEEAPRPVPSSGEEPLFAEDGSWVTRWHVSEIPFTQGETAEVRVRFRQGYSETAQFVSDDGWNSDATFSYTLSSAAIWKGPIRSGTITVVADTLYPAELQIEPRDRFTREGNTYTWEFEDLEPTAADDLKIRIHASSRSYYVFARERIKSRGDFPIEGEYILREGLTLFAHGRFHAEASSTLAPQGGKSYEAGNVADHDWETAWVEGAGGQGIGETLTLTMDLALPVHHIDILPGYAASEKLWKANSRVAKLEITANGEKTWIVEIPDGGHEKMHKLPLPGYAEPVETLRLRILDVHPGTKYEDTCITSIRVASKLDKRPEVQGAR